MTAPTLELLSCPFCDEQPELYPHDDQVACETEKCPIRRTRISIAAWNTRAHSLAVVDAGQGWQRDQAVEKIVAILNCCYPFDKREKALEIVDALMSLPAAPGEKA